MNVFIDTNVFLSFYHFTSDDLEELKKLNVLLEKKKIQLLIPAQVIQEFRRNRDSKLMDALKRLSNLNLNLQFPQFSKEYKENQQLRDLQKNYAIIHSKLMEKVRSDIDSQNLKADNLIMNLFNLGTKIPMSNTLLEKARTRIEVGNPPGKSNSLGDAINWEALLTAIPDNENIYFITDDKDYASSLNENVFNTFLLEEWSEIKKSKLAFYKSLSYFFKDHFPEITLATELEKDLLIRDLTNSGTFTETHSVIGKLKNYVDFTPAQINAIVAAAITNNQIYWIARDWDVEKFLRSIIRDKEDKINSTNLKDLLELLEPSKSEDNDEEIF